MRSIQNSVGRSIPTLLVFASFNCEQKGKKKLTKRTTQTQMKGKAVPRITPTDLDSRMRELVRLLARNAAERDFHAYIEAAKKQEEE